MNFYPHHIGDYLTATVHLSWLEDCSYRRLLDVYYSREQAIPIDVAQACRLVRASSKDERKAVETVLQEFFTQTPTGWAHGRCDEEIQKAKEAAERARLNGKKGGRPPIHKPTANPEITQLVSVANPEKSKSQAPITNTITNTNYSVPNGTGGKPPLTPTEIAFSYGLPLLTTAGTPERQARSFLGRLLQQDENKLVAVLRECIKAKPVQPLEWIAKAMLPEATGVSETKYQRAQREKMERDFPNLTKPESHHGTTALLG